MSYNMTQLGDGTNAAQWFLIINSWTEGILISGVVILLFFIVFGISYRASQRSSHSFLGTAFAMFLISGAAWFIRWENYVLVPTFLPVLFLILSGLGLLMVILEVQISQ